MSSGTSGPRKCPVYPAHSEMPREIAWGLLSTVPAACCLGKDTQAFNRQVELGRMTILTDVISKARHAPT